MATLGVSALVAARPACPVDGTRLERARRVGRAATRRPGDVPGGGLGGHITTTPGAISTCAKSLPVMICNHWPRSDIDAAEHSHVLRAIVGQLLRRREHRRDGGALGGGLPHLPAITFGRVDRLPRLSLGALTGPPLHGRMAVARRAPIRLLGAFARGADDDARIDRVVTEALDRPSVHLGRSHLRYGLPRLPPLALLPRVRKICESTARNECVNVLLREVMRPHAVPKVTEPVRLRDDGNLAVAVEARRAPDIALGERAHGGGARRQTRRASLGRIEWRVAVPLAA